MKVIGPFATRRYDRYGKQKGSLEQGQIGNDEIHIARPIDRLDGILGQASIRATDVKTFFMMYGYTKDGFFDVLVGLIVHTHDQRFACPERSFLRFLTVKKLDPHNLGLTRS
jgi:hypothetical protein